MSDRKAEAPDAEHWLQELMAIGDQEDNMTDKQRRIFNAAVEVFSEKGYSGTSTSEIAAKAGVAEGTIFRHYKTKKDLLFSIVSPIVARFVAPFLLKDFYKVLDSPYESFEAFLRAVLRNRFDFVRQHLPALRIMIQEIPFHAEFREPYRAIVVENVIPRIRNAINRYQAHGVLRTDIATESLIRHTMTTMLGFLFVRFMLMPDYAWDDEIEMERTIDLLLHGISSEMPPR